MLNFGMYKGYDLQKLITLDFPYCLWMINKIQNIDEKLDNDDKETLFKLTQPYNYLEKKYPNLFSKDINSIIKILGQENYIKRLNVSSNPTEPYVNSTYTLETIYASVYGSASCGGCDVGLQILPIIQQHLNKAKKFFHEYLERIKENNPYK